MWWISSSLHVGPDWRLFLNLFDNLVMVKTWYNTLCLIWQYYSFAMWFPSGIRFAHFEIMHCYLQGWVKNFSWGKLILGLIFVIDKMARFESIYCYSANLVWGQQQPLFPVLIEFHFYTVQKISDFIVCFRIRSCQVTPICTLITILMILRVVIKPLYWYFCIYGTN